MKIGDVYRIKKALPVQLDGVPDEVSAVGSLWAIVMTTNGLGRVEAGTVILESRTPFRWQWDVGQAGSDVDRRSQLDAVVRVECLREGTDNGAIGELFEAMT